MSDYSEIWNPCYTTSDIEIKSIWRSNKPNGIAHQKDYCKMNGINPNICSNWCQYWCQYVSGYISIPICRYADLAADIAANIAANVFWVT